MTIKFQRQYKLTVEIKGQQEIVITNPLTIEFMSNQTIDGTPDINIKIYNLSKVTRDLMFQDKPYIKAYKHLILQAGYGDGTSLPIVFIGTIQWCYSYRRKTETITEMYAFTGGYDKVNGVSVLSTNVGLTQAQILRMLSSDFKYITTGEIGDFNATNRRPLYLAGNTYDLMKKITDNQCFIANDVLSALKPNEVTQGDIVILSPESGLLSTPRRSDVTLEVTTLFEPLLKVGNLLQLNDNINQQYNHGPESTIGKSGFHKVIAVKHQGMISDAECGELVTEVRMRNFKNVAGDNSPAPNPIYIVKNGKRILVTDTSVAIHSPSAVLQYILQNNAVPQYQCVKDILWSSLINPWPQGGQIPTLAQLNNLVKIAAVLQTLMAEYYPGKVPTISEGGGWRSTAYVLAHPNEAKGTLHKNGAALDFNILNIDPISITRLLNQTNFPYALELNATDHVHIDLRPNHKFYG